MKKDRSAEKHSMLRPNALEELKQIGIDDAVAVQQAALDRYNKRA